MKEILALLERIVFSEFCVYDFELFSSNLLPQLWQIICDDHRKFNNFLQYGHRKKINPKIRSLIIRNVAQAIISVRIEFKTGIFDKKTMPIDNEAIPFSILLHFSGFIKSSNLYKVNYYFLYNTS